MYLVYSYQYNKELLSKGLYRGHSEELLGHYRRECLLVRRRRRATRRLTLARLRRLPKPGCFISAVGGVRVTAAGGGECIGTDTFMFFGCFPPP